MDLQLTKQTIEVEQWIGDGGAQALLRAEAMVPGAGREAVEVLIEDASLSLGQIVAQTDRVLIDGALSCQAAYRQGDEPLKAVAAQTTFSQSVEIEGVLSGMQARAMGSVEHVEARYENGRLVFQVAVNLKARVLKLEPVELLSTIGGVDDLEAQFAEICSAKLCAEASTQALLREEVSMPHALDARMALMEWSAVQVSGVRADLGGVRVLGEVQTETLIGTGVAARPVALVKVALPFDQLVELPEWLSADTTATAHVRNLATRLEADEGGEDAKLVIEAELVLEVRACGQDKATALVDAYATGKTAVRVETRTLSLLSGTLRVETAEPFKGTMLLADGAPAVGTVLAARVRPSLVEWSAKDGYTTMTGILEAGVLYMPGGAAKPCAARSELPFTIRAAGELPPEAWIQLTASGAEASALMSDRLELQCALNVSGSARVTREATAAVGAEAMEAPARRGGLTIVWPAKGDTLWSLGKRHGLPAREIARMNGELTALTPGKPVIFRG